MSTPLNGSVLKAFSILRLVTVERPTITAATVVSELGTNTATAHRFLLTLEEAGALTSDRKGVFCLGPAAAELGRLAELTSPMAARLQPLIAAVAQDLRESVMVCRLGRGGPTCIAVAASDRPITVNIDPGTVLPMAKTAQGKLWLSMMAPEERAHWPADCAALAAEDLDRIRSQGYATNLGDNEPDIAAVAVPVPGPDGRPVLTLSVFGMLSRFDDAFIERALQSLRSAVSRIRI